MAHEHDPDVQAVLLSADQFLVRGLAFIGVPGPVRRRRSDDFNVRAFKAHFGPHPNQCEKIWKDLLTIDNDAVRLDPDDMDLEGFFMALQHARICLTDDQRNPGFGNPDHHTMATNT